MKQAFLIACAFVLVAVTVPVYGQVLHADGPLPSFEVETISPMDGLDTINTPRDLVGRGQVVYSNLDARGLVAQAYGFISIHCVIGGPDWIDKQVYHIGAKIPDESFAQLQNMYGDERRKQVSLMLQSFMADRFKLKVHFETREMPVYELVVVSSSPKIPQSAPYDPTVQMNSPDGMEMTLLADGVHMNVRNMTMATFATSLQDAVVDRPVIDKTGLRGRFTFRSRFAKDGTEFADVGPSSACGSCLEPPLTAGDPNYAAPTFFTAIQNLGLKLISANVPVEVVVIDSIKRPSEN